jgi:hypothetical protein
MAAETTERSIGGLTQKEWLIAATAVNKSGSRSNIGSPADRKDESVSLIGQGRSRKKVSKEQVGVKVGHDNSAERAFEHEKPKTDTI